MSDDRVERGMRAMLELRGRRLGEGDRPIGWKVGFGAPAALEQLAIDRPLVGFLTDRGLLPDGAEVPIGDWTKAMLEAEIAVHIARDVEPGAGWEQVQSAVGGLSAAIELADVDPPPAEPEAILAGNIYHRHVLLGPVDHGRSEAQGVSARLLRNGEEIASTDTPDELTGEIIEIVRLTAHELVASGEQLRRGEVVITGSIFPPLPVAPGERVTAELPPLGSLTVTLRDYGRA
jgi:2-keto-4-pentenoate hydratase